MSELVKTYRHIAIYSLGILANRLVSFIMLPIYTKHLTPSDYGVLELLVMTVDVVALVIGAGISNGIFKFYYEREMQADRNRLISTAFQMVLFSYTAVALLCVFNADFFSDLVFGGQYKKAIELAFWTMLFQVCITVPLTYIRALQRPSLFVAVSLFRLVLSLSLNIYFIVVKGMGVLGAVYADFISTLIVGIGLALFTFVKVGFGFDLLGMKKLYKFGAPFVLTNIGAFILTFSDRYFIRIFGDLREVGVYALGYKLGFVLSVFVARAFNNVWEAQRFEIIKQSGYEDKFNSVLKTYSFFLLTCFLGFSLFARDLFRIMSTEEFIEAYKIVPFVTLAYVIQALTSFFNFGIIHSGKSILLTIATFFSVISIIFLSLLLIPVFGGVGAAISTLGAFLVRLIFVYVFSQKYFRINYHFSIVIKQVTLSIMICVIYFILYPFLENWNSSLWASIIYSCVFFLLFLLAVYILHLVPFSPRMMFSKIISRELL